MLVNCYLKKNAAAQFLGERGRFFIFGGGWVFLCLGVFCWGLGVFFSGFLTVFLVVGGGFFYFGREGGKPCGAAAPGGGN